MKAVTGELVCPDVRSELVGVCSLRDQVADDLSESCLRVFELRALVEECGKLVAVVL